MDSRKLDASPENRASALLGRSLPSPAGLEKTQRFLQKTRENQASAEARFRPRWIRENSTVLKKTRENPALASPGRSSLSSSGLAFGLAGLEKTRRFLQKTCENRASASLSAPLGSRKLDDSSRKPSFALAQPKLAFGVARLASGLAGLEKTRRYPRKA